MWKASTWVREDFFSSCYVNKLFLSFFLFFFILEVVWVPLQCQFSVCFNDFLLFGISEVIKITITISEEVPSTVPQNTGGLRPTQQVALLSPMVPVVSQAGRLTCSSGFTPSQIKPRHQSGFLGYCPLGLISLRINYSWSLQFSLHKRATSKLSQFPRYHDSIFGIKKILWLFEPYFLFCFWIRLL